MATLVKLFYEIDPRLFFKWFEGTKFEIVKLLCHLQKLELWFVKVKF